VLSEKVKLAKSGDEEALSFVTEQIRTELWSLSGKWRFSHWDREDAVQQSLANICEKLPGLKNEHYFRLWCRRILENICNDMCKRKKMWGSFTPLKEDEECLARTCPSIDGSEDLENYLSLMSKEMAETFRKRYVYDYSIKAIAQLQNIPEGTVNSRLHRGKQLLQSNYQLYKGD
jgi:RNA polymerase sigma-70 factor (ECF subfamily)